MPLLDLTLAELRPVKDDTGRRLFAEPALGDGQVNPAGHHIAHRVEAQRRFMRGNSLRLASPVVAPEGEPYKIFALRGWGGAPPVYSSPGVDRVAPVRAGVHYPIC